MIGALFIITIWIIGWYWALYLSLKLDKKEGVEKPDYADELFMSFTLWYILIPLYYAVTLAISVNEGSLRKFFDNWYDRIDE